MPGALKAKLSSVLDLETRSLVESDIFGAATGKSNTDGASGGEAHAEIKVRLTAINIVQWNGLNCGEA